MAPPDVYLDRCEPPCSRRARRTVVGSSRYSVKLTGSTRESRACGCHLVKDRRFLALVLRLSPACRPQIERYLPLFSFRSVVAGSYRMCARNRRSSLSLPPSGVPLSLIAIISGTTAGQIEVSLYRLIVVFC